MLRLLCGFLVVLSTAVWAEPQLKALTFGVVPQQSATRLARQWGPLLQAVGQRSGYQLRFKTARDIPTFERRLAAGDYDFAYINPYQYVVFNRSPGYRAFARERGHHLHGVIVVQRDSAIDSINQLAGRKVAFPSPTAFAASMLPRAELRQRGVVIEPVYVASHDSVYRSVAAGLFPAGGGIQSTLDGADSSSAERLRVLWQTKGYTPHVFTALPWLSPELVRRVGDAFIGLGNDEAGRKLLTAAGFGQDLQAATDADWDDVRALRIDLPESTH